MNVLIVVIYSGHALPCIRVSKLLHAEFSAYLETVRSSLPWYIWWQKILSLTAVQRRDASSYRHYDSDTLSFLVQHGDIEAVQWALEVQPNLKQRTLRAAVKCNNWPMLYVLVEFGSSVDNGRCRVLCHDVVGKAAAYYNNLPMLLWIIHRGARAFEYYAADAARGGHVLLTQMLISWSGKPPTSFICSFSHDQPAVQAMLRARNVCCRCTED